ncbi:MAG: OmpH family outer membrane protein [Sinobacterium sp.]|nr:OmpH family outer membrane protein [Sinobacterium sp.]
MSKPINSFARLVLVLSLSVVFCSQALANGKVAVVDFQKAILTTDVAKARISKLESEPAYKENISRATNLTKEAQALFAQYKKEEPLMSAEKKSEQQGRLKDLESDIKHLQTKIQEQNKQALAPVIYAMQAAAQQAVEALRKEEGYGLILVANPQIILYADTSYDITAKVTDRLNKLASKK